MANEENPLIIMLNVQKYLLNRGTFEQIKEELGISAKFHPDLPLVILNYSQINSPKLNPIVRECRGLVLNSQTFEIVSRSFNRFFNWGEVVEEQDNFDFSDFVIQSKEDGSLIQIYWFQDKWRVNTRNTFGDMLIDCVDFTWEQLVLKILRVNSIDELGLDKTLSYTCELCSPYNKIVRKYEPSVYLLTAFIGENEVPWRYNLYLHVGSGHFYHPALYEFQNIEQIQSWLRKQSEDDPTFEGVVIRDKNNNRWKIKNPTYLALHKLKNNDNLFLERNLLPFILNGEIDELITYFPETIEALNLLTAKLDSHYNELNELWEVVKRIDSQKDFALSIIGKTPFFGILFNMRKDKMDNLKGYWAKSGDLIEKVLDL
jgi:hypothetical protein